jgi:phosphatidylserine decarboxylase
MKVGLRPLRFGRWQWAAYGWRELLLLVAVAAAGTALSLYVSLYYLVPAFVALAAFVLYFFRDPQREPPPGAENILAPADGRVVEIAEVNEREFLGEPAVKVGIFLSLFDVHINRAPCGGEVEYLRYERGKFFNALRRKAARFNENNAIGIAEGGAGGRRVLVRQIAGRVARRIVCACTVGQEVEPGEKIGMIKFGSRTELYVPLSQLGELQVTLGEKVRAGESVLGTFR